MSPYLTEALASHRRHTAELLVRLDALCASGVDPAPAQAASDGAGTTVLLARLTDRLRADDDRLATLVAVSAAEPAPAATTVPSSRASTQRRSRPTADHKAGTTWPRQQASTSEPPTR